MKVYLVMLDSWWMFGDCYDSLWDTCNILSVCDSFEKAKKKLAEEREKMLKDLEDYSEANFFEFLNNLGIGDECDRDKKEICEDVFNRWYKGRSKDKLVEVLAPKHETEPYFFGYLNGHTYFFYILEKEVE